MRLIVPIATLAAFLLLACTGPQVSGPTWEQTSGGAPVSGDSEAAASFADAERLYASGDYEAALEAFRIFGAEHPGDPLAVRAEIYSARCLAALGRTLEAEGAFLSLHQAPDGPATRTAAALYVAFVGSLRGETEYAIEFLVDALSADGAMRVPEDWIVPGDEALLASLLAEARIATGAGPAALVDLELVARTGDDVLAEYAADRALEVADAEQDRRMLQAAFDGGSDFVKAAVAPRLAAALRAAGDPDAAREVLLRAEGPALEWGRPERISEEFTRLAASGPAGEARYGVALSLTGPSRRAGRAALGAVLLAQRAFEDRPALSTVLIRDTQGTADGTRRAIAELADAGVSVIIGPIDAALADAARNAAADAALPIVLLSPVAFERGRDASFRWLIDPVAEAEAVVDVAFARGASTFVIATQPSADAAPFFVAFADACREAIAARGGRVVDTAVVTSDPDDATVAQDSSRRASEQIDSDAADALVLALPDDLAATLVAYLASQDIWPSPDGSTRSASGRRQMTYLGNSFVVTDALVRNSSSYMRGAVLPYWFDAELATGAGREFADRFFFTYGRDPGTVEAFAFDLATAIRRLLLDESALAPDRVASRLAGGVDIDGVVGAVRFDADGNPSVAPRMCTVRGDQFAAP